MYRRAVSQLFPRVGIDLGTARTRVWTEAGGVVFDEPSCLAFDTTTRKVIAVGTEAVSMQGRVGPHVEVRWPVVDGTVADPEVAVAVLRVALQKSQAIRFLSQPVIMASLPASASAVARDTVVEVLYKLGSREVYTIAQPLAASIGAGVPIADASGTFLLQMGAGVVEASVISLGSLVETVATTHAGKYLTQRIRATVKRELELVISLETAEELQHLVASVRPGEDKRLLVTGQDLTLRSPKELEVTSAQLQPVASELLHRYETMLRQLISQLPPELTVDVIDKGLLLSGGLAALEGADSYFVHALGIPVSVVEQTETAVIRGIGVTLEHLSLFKQSLGYQS